MTFAELTQSNGWKNFMKYLYGLGAAVVIIGALFKITHWPGATLMLIIGMGTEAVIFIFSAFEPLHEDLDWTLVYPELAGLDESEEMAHSIHGGGKSRDHHGQKHAVQQVTHGHPHWDKYEQGEESGSGVPAPVSGGVQGFAMPALDDETVKKLGEGFSKLTTTVSKLADITDAASATSDYTTAIKMLQRKLKV